MTYKPVLHYALTLEEVREERYIDPRDYLDCPPKACKNGNYHAGWTAHWEKVTCPACLAKRPKDEA